MPLESDYKALVDAHRKIMTHYTVLTERKVKSAAPKLRKALMEMANVCKDMRKSAQTYKDRL